MAHGIIIAMYPIRNLTCLTVAPMSKVGYVSERLRYYIVRLYGEQRDKAGKDYVVGVVEDMRGDSKPFRNARQLMDALLAKSLRRPTGVRKGVDRDDLR